MSKRNSDKRRSSRAARRPQSGEQPQWRPVSFLPTLAEHIDGMLAADREQYTTLLQAKDKPHVLDDYTVDRVITVFSDQAKDFWLFEEQLARWQAESLTDGQREEVTRLVAQMKAIRENNTQVLALARQLSEGTIDKIMEKSDEEMGLEFLLKGFKI